MAFIVFIHQNMPGQFRHLAARLAAEGNRVLFVTEHVSPLPGVESVAYELHREPHPATHAYLRGTERTVLRGQAVARVLVGLRDRGPPPHLIYAHPGWGEALFVKDVFPHVPLVTYAEWYYTAVGRDVGFDPDEPVGLDRTCQVRMRNAHLLVSHLAADWRISPTRWQKSQHPSQLHDGISVIHDGVPMHSLERSRLEDAARRTVRARYDLEPCLSRQVRVLQQLIRGQRPDPAHY